MQTYKNKITIILTDKDKDKDTDADDVDVAFVCEQSDLATIYHKEPADSTGAELLLRAILKTLAAHTEEGDM